MNMITDFIRRFRRRRQVLSPIRIRAFSMATLMVLTMATVSPQLAHAQRGSTSKGKTERSSERRVERGSKSSSKARSGSNASRSRSRSEAVRSAGKAIESARKASANRSRSQSARATSRSGRSNAGERGSQAERGRAGKAVDRSSRTDRSNRPVIQDRSAASSRDRSSGRVGERVLDRSANGRVAAGRGATDVQRDSRVGKRGNNRSIRDNRSNNRDRQVVLNGRRARLSLPGVRATWRSSGHQHVRYRTRVTLAPRYVHVRPHRHINVHIAWPWQVRYTRHWSPRYRYRQVVVVRADWGHSHRTSRIEMETTYRHRVRFANEDYAVLDIDIEQIALYDNGRYIGMVDRIPDHLSSVEATVFRNGDIAFDRDIFLVGDRRAGFEIISTEFYDGYAGQGYRYGDDISVGRVDLRNGRVRSVGRSRLFNPNSWRGFAPISLLPEDEGWLWDYGSDAISAVYDDYDAYYGGSNAGWSRSRAEEARRAENRFDYDTEFGASFSVNRTAEIRRVE